MKFTLKTKEYLVKWKHLYEVEVDIGKQITYRVPKGTICKIYLEEEKLAEGLAIVHPNDNFNKKVGRKVSFTKALNSMRFTKSQRTNIWKQYLAQ